MDRVYGSNMLLNPQWEGRAVAWTPTQTQTPTRTASAASSFPETQFTSVSSFKSGFYQTVRLRFSCLRRGVDGELRWLFACCVHVGVGRLPICPSFPVPGAGGEGEQSNAGKRNHQAPASVTARLAPSRGPQAPRAPAPHRITLVYGPSKHRPRQEARPCQEVS